MKSASHLLSNLCFYNQLIQLRTPHWKAPRHWCARARAHARRQRSLPRPRAEDGGAKLDAQWSFQMRVLVSAGEQVHQGRATVPQTDECGEFPNQNRWQLTCLGRLGHEVVSTPPARGTKATGVSTCNFGFKHELLRYIKLLCSKRTKGCLVLFHEFLSCVVLDKIVGYCNIVKTVTLVIICNSF